MIMDNVSTWSTAQSNIFLMAVSAALLGGAFVKSPSVETATALKQTNTKIMTNIIKHKTATYGNSNVTFY